MHKDVARRWHIAWLCALAAQAAAADEIRFPDPCATPARVSDEDELFVWRTEEELQRRQIATAVKKEMERHLEKLPGALRCSWWEAFREHSAAEKLLYAQVHKEREAIEADVFSGIAARLGLPTIADLYLHTDLADENGVIRKRSHVIEPLTDFVRRGVDFGLRLRATKNARDYIRYTRVSRRKAYSEHIDRDIDFQRVVDVLADYDAAGRVRDIVDARFSDATSPWSTPLAVKDAAKAEFRFAALEALRKGDITSAQHSWLLASIDADRGDGAGKLTYAHYALRMGRTWFSGQAPHPIQLPAFNIRLSPSTREQFTTNFLYVPGHPDGALRILPVGTSPATMILGDLDNAEQGRKLLGWLASRLPPADFHELLGELADPVAPSDTPRRHRRAVQDSADKTNAEPNVLTRWLSGQLRTVFGATGKHTPNIQLDLYPAGERPLRFIDAVAGSQLSRARSSMDPRFVGKLDADCARLEQIAMGVVDEVLELALRPFPLHGLEKLQFLSIMGMMAQSTATYLATPRAGDHEAPQLVADLVDFGVSLGLGVAAAKVGQRPQGPLPTLYKSPGSDRTRLWFDLDTYNHALPALPKGTSAGEQGVYRKENELFVRLKTRHGEQIVRVVPDGATYRIAMADGGAGPLLHRRRDGLWSLPSTEQSIDSGAFAGLLLADYTTDASTLARTRKLMRQFGLKERDLARMKDQGERLGANQIMLGAVGHAILQEQVGRLRNRQDGRWTNREVDAVVPAMARHIHHPIALLADDGSVDTVVLADGTAGARDGMPADALRVQRKDDRYLLPDGTSQEYSSIFAAVDAATRPAGRAVDLAESEARFREALADSIDGTTKRASLERLHARLIDPLPLPPPQKEAFKEMSYLQLALHDRHYALSAAEEMRILTAARDLMPEGMHVRIEVRRHGTHGLLAAFGDETPAVRRIVIEADVDASGHRTAYYRQDSQGEARLSRPVEASLSPLLDATLNAGNGEVRHALNMGEYQWSDFADRLMERIVDNPNPDDMTRPLVDAWESDPDLLHD